jgi:uncharacterized protein YjiS (DUF1127 family)
MMSAHLSNPPARALADAISALLDDVARNGGGVFATWAARIRLRHDLARLLDTDRRLLEDAGFDVAFARSEIDKPFWRA